jgi:cell wall-associated NlpC family hydrolase
MTEFAPYIGIPFKELGRDRHGVDCYGLVRLVLWEVFKVATSDFRDYHISEREDCAAVIKQASGTPEWEKVNHPQPGDVILLRLMGFPTHCGIYVGNGEMLHASETDGVRLERLNSPAWSRRVCGMYRHRGMRRG